MALSTIQDAVILGMIFSIMSLGVFISFRVLNIPDLTIDGSFTTGCAVSAVFAMNAHPFIGTLMAFLAGGLAGLVTGLLQTKCKVQSLLAGILTMTALYSVNLKILNGMPNVSLFGKKTIFTPLEAVLGDHAYGVMIAGLLILLILDVYKRQGMDSATAGSVKFFERELTDMSRNEISDLRLELSLIHI